MLKGQTILNVMEPTKNLICYLKFIHLEPCIKTLIGVEAPLIKKPFVLNNDVLTVSSSSR